MIPHHRENTILVSGTPPCLLRSGSSSAQENNLEASTQTILQRQTTPERQPENISEYDYLNTPHSHYSSSYTATVPLDETKILPVKEFATTSLNLNIDDDSDVMLKDVNEAFNKYVQVVVEAKNEQDPCVYPALIALLNAIPNDNLRFYGQASSMVQGSLVNQRPDIGALLKELAGPGKKDINTKTLWAHLMMVVESKVGKGKYIIPEFGIDADADTDAQRENEDLEPKIHKSMSTNESDTTSESGLQQHPGSQKQPEEGDEHLRLFKVSRTSSMSQALLSGDPSTNTSDLKKIYVIQAGPDTLGEVFNRKSAEGVRAQAMGYAAYIVLRQGGERGGYDFGS
ncbi:hypothetical protein F5050DRAFT_1807929 [Lentinula boryana]|uniref:Uncharacterized protein n=1 Tax=Lentinula boryana TaxID=40481 RepID=A0ABQ8QCJ6_9AGAR|nr:hypothetical protein F5050DRAFT_1807929 [Lentinula boryana]